MHTLAPLAYEEYLQFVYFYTGFGTSEANVGWARRIVLKLWGVEAKHDHVTQLQGGKARPRIHTFDSLNCFSLSWDHTV